MPERREEHHTLAATVGAMLFTVGGAGLIGLWMAAAGPHPSLPSSTPLFFPVLVALVVMVAVGLYMASTPWTGLPLRSPRAVGLLSDPQALVDPHTSTLKALNQIRTELSHAHQMIQAARAQGRYWPRLAEGHLSVKMWRQNRSHLQGTPGLRQLPHSLDVAYEQIRRISDIRGGRVLGRNLVEAKDDLDTAIAATGQALALLTKNIQRLNKNLPTREEERQSRGLVFGGTKPNPIPRPDIRTTEMVWLVEVRSRGDKTIDEVEVVLESVDPDQDTIHKQRLRPWHDHRSEDQTTSIPPGKPVWFGVTHQDWADGTDPPDWAFMYASGDLNPKLGFEPREIELAAYGRDVDPVRARFSIRVGDHQRVEVHPLDASSA